MATPCASRASLCFAAWLIWLGPALGQEFDLVLAHGRVLDIDQSDPLNPVFEVNLSTIANARLNRMMEADRAV